MHRQKAFPKYCRTANFCIHTKNYLPKQSVIGCFKYDYQLVSFCEYFMYLNYLLILEHIPFSRIAAQKSVFGQVNQS